MDPIGAKTAMKELTLLLMYLSRFNEKSPFGDEQPRTWKGYDFGVLKELLEEEAIWDGSHPSRTKSVTLSPQGLSRAVDLLKKYNISDWD